MVVFLSDFILIVLEVCEIWSSPELLSCALLRVNLKISRGILFHLFLLLSVSAGYPVPPVVECLHSGTTSLPHSMGKAAKNWGIWELIRDLGILVHSSPPGLAYLQLTSFIWRIFFGLPWVGVALFQTEQSTLC